MSELRDFLATLSFHDMDYSVAESLYRTIYQLLVKKCRKQQIVQPTDAVKADLLNGFTLL